MSKCNENVKIVFMNTTILFVESLADNITQNETRQTLGTVKVN